GAIWRTARSLPCETPPGGGACASWRRRVLAAASCSARPARSSTPWRRRSSARRAAVRARWGCTGGAARWRATWPSAAPAIAGPGWRKEIRLDGVKGAHYGIGVLAASAEAIAAFAPVRDEIPEWLRARGPEEQGGRGCRRRASDAPTLPAGTTLLASVEVVL